MFASWFSLYLLFGPEDGETKLLRNDNDLLSNYQVFQKTILHAGAEVLTAVFMKSYVV
jgi:hypothetical protein